MSDVFPLSEFCGEIQHRISQVIHRRFHGPGDSEAVDEIVRSVAPLITAALTSQADLIAANKEAWETREDRDRLLTRIEQLKADNAALRADLAAFSELERAARDLDSSWIIDALDGLDDYREKRSK